MIIQVKRVYASPSRQDGYRALVDRIWPRGIRRSDAQIDEWWKDCAPSTELRTWFGHDPAKWHQFERRYKDELDAKRADVNRFIERLAPGAVTLVYAARDEQHNHAIVLKRYLQDQIDRGA